MTDGPPPHLPVCDTTAEAEPTEKTSLTFLVCVDVSFFNGVADGNNGRYLQCESRTLVLYLEAW